MLNLNLDFKKPYLNSIFSTNSAIWYERNLKEKIIKQQSKINVIFEVDSTDKSIEFLKKQNLNWLINQEEINAAYKYNHYWCSVKFNDQIIACIKIGFNKIFISDYNKIIKFPKNMAFIYDTFVLPKYRGKGVGNFIIYQAIKHIKNKGYLKIGCHIPPWNKNSIKIYKKNGFKEINYIRNLKIFGVSIQISRSPKKILINNGGNIFYE